MKRDSAENMLKSFEAAVSRRCRFAECEEEMGQAAGVAEAAVNCEADYQEQRIALLAALTADQWQPERPKWWRSMPPPPDGEHQSVT